MQKIESILLASPFSFSSDFKKIALRPYIDETNDFIIKTRPGMGKAGVLGSLKKQRAIVEKEPLIQKSVTNSRKNSVVAAAGVNC